MSEKQQLKFTMFRNGQPGESLAKEYWLEGDKLKSRTAAELTRGWFETKSVTDIHAFGDFLMENTGKHDCALAYGTAEQPNGIIATKKAISKGIAAKGAIARSQKNFPFQPAPGIMLLDHDGVKADVDGTGMRRPVEAIELDRIIRKVLPEFGRAKRIYLPSNSSEIFTDDEVKMSVKNGWHSYVALPDMTKAKAITSLIFSRLVDAGYGHVEFAANGRKLLRTLIDASVPQGERLDFAFGGKYLDGLKQYRYPFVVKGDLELLDAEGMEEGLWTWRNTSPVALKLLKDAERESKRIRADWIERKVDDAIREGVDPDVARRDYEQFAPNGNAVTGTLPGHFRLTAADGTQVTVRELFEDPKRWNMESFFDPVEPDYGGGRPTAIVYMTGASQKQPTLFSWAHGGFSWKLQVSENVPIAQGHRTQLPDISDAVPQAQAAGCRDEGGDEIGDTGVIPASVLVDMREVRARERQAGGDGTAAAAAVAVKALERDPDPTPIPPPGFSDQELAQVCAEKYKDVLRYTALRSTWMWFDGKRWQEEKTLLAFDLVANALREVAGRLREKDKKYRAELLSARKRASVENMMRHDRRMAATMEQWDTHPWLLQTPAGIYDLRSGENIGFDAEKYLTQMTAVAPDWNMPTPIWDKFLDWATCQDVEVAKFLMRVMGYALTGVTSEHALFFWWGLGGNGKGVIIHVMEDIMADYACPTSVETFVEQKTPQHSTEIAKMHNARLVVATETEKHHTWAAARLKTLSGGDRQSARFMRQDEFKFDPKFKIIISGNNKPRFHNVDEALRRRLHMVNFNAVIPEEEKGNGMEDRMRATELPGILAKVIDGCRDWQRGGLRPPKAVLTATADYLEAEDVHQQWLDMCVIRDPNAKTRLTTFFESWKMFADARNQTIGTSKQLCEEISKHWGNVRRRLFRGAVMFDGIRLKTHEERKGDAEADGKDEDAEFPF